MTRLKLTVAYVGTAYHGWQTQAHPHKTLPTVQSLLEAVVSRIVGHPVHVHGAGRTDAGVHALAQVAHVDIPDHKVNLDWQLAFNTSLPRDIRIIDVAVVPDTFHAQFSAVRKTYEYSLWLSRRYTPPRMAPFVWGCGPLDVARMDEAVRYMVGTHDFSSLKNRGTDLKTTIRTVYSITRTPSCTLPLEDTPLELVWQFQADGFLKQMVRNLMGVLVAAGRHKLAPDTIPAILAACDRRHPGVTAPAYGLTLKHIDYGQVLCPDECFSG